MKFTEWANSSLS